jgi:uncharacterized protein YbaP (TraB family)
MNLRVYLFLLLVFTPVPDVGALPLWELTGTRNNIRLLGSVHLLRASDYPLPRAMDAAYEDADIIVMEADLSRQNTQQMQLTVQKLAIDARGRGLSDLIDARAYRQVAAKTAQINIDIAMLQPFEPWFAALQITQLRMLQLGFDMSFGVDMHYTERAQRDGKRIVGLESIEDQLTLMDTLAPKTQQMFLLQTIDEAEGIEDSMDAILSAWRRGDARGLQKEMLAGMQDQPELYQRIIVARNRNWAGAIQRFADDSQDYLIVVGTLHLVGPDSVLHMLEDAGYPSRQIKR